MKTTIDIPDVIMEEAASYANVKTKREVILAALEEYNHTRRVEKVIAMFGTFKTIMTNDEIEALETKRHNALFAD